MSGNNYYMKSTHALASYVAKQIDLAAESLKGKKLAAANDALSRAHDALDSLLRREISDTLPQDESVEYFLGCFVDDVGSLESLSDEKTLLPLIEWAQGIGGISRILKDLARGIPADSESRQVYELVAEMLRREEAVSHG